ncbi:MAG: DNA-binding protein [Candidatus Aenigmarchaeota archaeon]|nr:DNA-binding protein [Candidatus Aenigmarchaeota archaeon]
MKIKDLRIGQNVDYLRAKVIDKEEKRQVMSKFGRALSVANVLLEDETGNIKLTLWGKDIDRVKEGDTVEIKDAYVKEFRGEKQLTLGRKGSMEVV